MWIAGAGDTFQIKGRTSGKSLRQKHSRCVQISLESVIKQKLKDEFREGT